MGNKPEAPKPAQAQAQPPATEATAAAPPAAPILDIKERIASVKEEIESLRKELTSFSGRLRNRDPEVRERLTQENKRLSEKMEQQVKALFALLSERYRARELGEAKQQAEVLRLATIDYCKKAKVDEQLWKKIES